MGSFLDAVGVTRLDETDLVDPHHLDKLRALSVTSVEEMLSIVEAAPEAAGMFMEGTTLAQLEADAGMKAPNALAAVASARNDHVQQYFALGANQPDDVGVEEVASEATFAAMMAELSGKPAPSGQRVDMLDCFGPVRNQGKRGTCVAHATAAVVDCLFHRLGQGLGDFSPQFVFYWAKQNDGHGNEDGTWARVAFPTLEVNGVCWERSWPYESSVDPASVHHGPPPNAAKQEALGYISSGTVQLDPRDSKAIRDVLDEEKPVAISVPVYQNWWGPATKAYGKIPMPLPNSLLDGGHAMCAVGYDFDDEFTGGGYFILRNSWGTSWADQSPIAPGYGAIPFEYIDRYGWEAFTIASWPTRDSASES